MSVHTLSTPHHGSILAFISYKKAHNKHVNSTEDDSIRIYLGNQGILNIINKIPGLGIGPEGDALRDMQPAWATAFLDEHPFPLQTIELYTYGADADLDDSGDITAGPSPTLDEVDPMIPHGLYLVPNARDKVTKAFTANYKILRQVSEVKVTRRRNSRGATYIFLNGNFGAVDRPNDLIVTDESATYSTELHRRFDKNHTHIKDADVISVVLATIGERFPL